MILFQYLDWLPKIPPELLIDPYVPDESKIGFQDTGYTRWAIPKELETWLFSNISQEVGIAGYQIISQDVNAHCDRRSWAVNYIVDTGGTEVVTSLWQQPGQPIIRQPSIKIPAYAKLDCIQSHCIEPGRWHLLNTHVLHSVRGIRTQRSAVTVGLNSEDPLLEIFPEPVK